MKPIKKLIADAEVGDFVRLISNETKTRFDGFYNGKAITHPTRFDFSKARIHRYKRMKEEDKYNLDGLNLIGGNLPKIPKDAELPVRITHYRILRRVKPTSMYY